MKYELFIKYSLCSYKKRSKGVWVILTKEWKKLVFLLKKLSNKFTNEYPEAAFVWVWIHTRIVSANSIASANSRPDLTEHWIRTHRKQLRQSSNVMARKMYESMETSTELQWVLKNFSSWNCKDSWLSKRNCPQLGAPSQTRFVLIHIQSGWSGRKSKGAQQWQPQPILWFRKYL